MDFLPRTVEVDAGDTQVVAVEHETMVEPVLDGGIEEDTLGILPSRHDRLVAKVGKELVEVARTEPFLTAPTRAGQGSAATAPRPGRAG